MTTPPADLLTRYLAGTCTPDERQRVEEWYDAFGTRPALSDVRPETAEPAYQQELFRRVQAALDGVAIDGVALDGVAPDERQPVVVPLRRTRWWAYAAAASVAAVLLAALWWRVRIPAPASPAAPVPSVAAVFRNAQPRIVAHRLPDGSTVWLNPGAQIRYPRRFAGGTRDVAFEGEGFFDVKKDPRHPFVIRSGAMTTEVLGTSFNVRADPAARRYEVAVVTGKVAVSLQKPGLKTVRRVVLTPRQRAVLAPDQPEPLTRFTDDAPKQAPYEPVSVAFDWMPLDEVARRLEVLYAVNIEITNPNLRKCRLKADFTNERLPVILDLLGKSVNATYTLDPTTNTISLTGAGCPE